MNIMKGNAAVTVPAAAVAVLLLAACSATAQTIRQVTPAATLRCFEQVKATGSAKTECDEGVVPVAWVTINPGHYEHSAVLAVADGLVELAVDSDDIRLRTSAIAEIGLLGRASAEGGRPIAGAVERLIKVYEGSDRWGTKRQVILSMRDQAEEPSAVSFLAEVVENETPDDPHPINALPAMAVYTLARMGPSGAATLQRLHSSGTVESAVAMRQMDKLSKTAYRIAPSN